MDIDNSLRLGIRTNLIKEIKKQVGSSSVSFLFNNTGTRTMYIFENELKYIEYINNIVDTILDDVVTEYKQSNNFTEDVIGDIAKEIRQELQNSSNGKFRIYGKEVSLPFVMFAKLQNGKVIERKFGRKISDRKYTQEEIKVILKEAEEVECNEKFEDGRKDKFTFLSAVVDIDNELLKENGKNPIRFITPDNNDKDKVYKEIYDVVNQAKQDLNSLNILLIPYSADGHIVTLLVDKHKFPNENSIMCFDSSHYFTGYIGKKFSKRFFPKEIYKTLGNKKLPINKEAPQQKDGNCSFYTEGFIKAISIFLQSNPKANFEDITKYINNITCRIEIIKYKDQYFNEYSSRKHVSIITEVKNISRNLLRDNVLSYEEEDMYFQELLNEYANMIIRRAPDYEPQEDKPIYKRNQKGELVKNKDYRYFNKEQQDVLIPNFIESEILNKINPNIPILSKFALFDDIGVKNMAKNRPYSFIFTTGVGDKINQRGTHYVAAQFFRDQTTGELMVLYYDSLNGTISNEFTNYVRKQFGNSIRILNITNQDKFTQQDQGINTCGLCALTALRRGGILDQTRERIMKLDISQDTNINLYGIQEEIGHEQARVRQEFDCFSELESESKSEFESVKATCVVSGKSSTKQSTPSSGML